MTRLIFRCREKGHEDVRDRDNSRTAHMNVLSKGDEHDSLSSFSAPVARSLKTLLSLSALVGSLRLPSKVARSTGASIDSMRARCQESSRLQGGSHSIGNSLLRSHQEISEVCVQIVVYAVPFMCARRITHCRMDQCFHLFTAQQFPDC